MNHIIYLICLVVLFTSNAFAQISFEGAAMPVITDTPSTATGLDNIYVLYTTSGVTMTYTTSSASNTVKWYKFGAQGGGYAEEIDVIEYDGAISRLTTIIPNSGYIIEEIAGGEVKRKYLWVVNYADYFLEITDISFDMEYADDACNTARLRLTGSGPDIKYATLNGQPKVLSRELKLVYSTMQWDSDNLAYIKVDNEEVEDSFHEIWGVTAPLCNTKFHLTGDRFLNFWNQGIELETPEYSTGAVSVEATVTQLENGNNKNTEGGLGGSAPVDIEFKGYYTDAVLHKEWQIASDPEFQDILYRYYEENITHTFNEAGTFYIRFVGANSDGSCEAQSETFTVDIGESKLECPNAFSPESTPGINDEWKVSYKSIISFKCWIFNRWGVQMFYFDNPELGWDGKYNGKYVGPGVYFYVIEAKGADGKNYKMKGDINIINAKK